MIKDMLTFYDVGVVISDNKKGDRVISLHPIDTSHTTEGAIDIKESITGEIHGGAGAIEKPTVEKSTTLTATWLNLGDPNRVSAPNVSAGESVFIYRFKDTDKFFWSTYGLEVDLRTNETVLYLYNNSKKGVVPTKDNSYYVLWDTQNKRVHIHTSANDGEMTTYDIEINPGKGFLTIKDGKGSEMTIDSEKKTIRRKTTRIVDEADTIELKCKTLTVNGKTDIKNDLTVNKKLTVKGSSVFHKRGTFKKKAGDKIKDFKLSKGRGFLGSVADAVI